MKRIPCLLVAVPLLAACMSTITPASSDVISPSLTATVTSVPTATKMPTSTLGIPTATITPMSVVPVSANKWTLDEFNAGTEMKRLNVIGTGTPHDIKFSPDGKLLAVATGRGIYLYDGITFEQSSFIDVNDSVSAIAFSPDADILAVAVNGKVSLWNVLSGRSILQLEGGMISISSLAYGKGGYVAALGGECRGCGTPVLGMILWNSKKGYRIYAEHDIWYDTTALTFTEDGKQLVYGGNRGITTIESDTGKLVSLYGGSKDANFPYNLVFNNDKSHFIISTYFFNEYTMIADIHTQKEVTLPQCGLYITRAREVGACLKQKSILLIDGTNGQKIKSFDIDVDSDILRDMFALSPDGKFLVYYGKYGLYVLETSTSSTIKTLDFTDFTSAQLGIVEVDGTQKYVVAKLSSYGQADIYDLQAGTKLRTINLDCCAIVGFAFAPNQKTVATVDDGNNLLLWDIQSRKVIYNVILKDYENSPIVFSPDGTSIYFLKETEGEALEFVFATGKIITHTTKPYSYVRVDSSVNDNYHFNKLGNLVMLGFQNSNPVFEDIETDNTIIIPFEARADADFNLKFAFSNDENFLMLGTVSGILVWDLETYKVTSTLIGHEFRSGDGWGETIRSLLVNPQSNLLVSVGWDGTTRLWNITAGTELRRLNVCCSASFTPDGRYLVTAGDGVIRVWGIP